MSWLEKVQTDYTIYTGDDKPYRGLWMRAKTSTEYNTSLFNFKGVKGTLVDRRLAQGERYDVEIHFQGDDHIDKALAFRTSADNPKAWTIFHPLYGKLFVQPLGIELDNEKANVTRITATVVTTLGKSALKITVSAPDKIAADKIATDTVLADSYVTDVPEPKISGIQAMINNINGFYEAVSAEIKSATDFSAYLNAYNKLNTLVNNVVFDTLAVIKQIQDFASLPARFADSIANRLKMFQLQLAFLSNGVAKIVTPGQKKLYENNAGTLVTAMMLTSVTNYSYANRDEVAEVISLLTEMFDTYAGTLEYLQSTNGTILNGYMPDPDAFGAVERIFNYTITSLLDIASSAKQQRTMYLTDDTDVIQLAYKLYGLQADDSTIDRLIADNAIGSNEFLGLSKDRKIKYYV